MASRSCGMAAVSICLAFAGCAETRSAFAEYVLVGGPINTLRFDFHRSASSTVNRTGCSGRRHGPVLRRGAYRDGAGSAREAELTSIVLRERRSGMCRTADIQDRLESQVWMAADGHKPSLDRTPEMTNPAEAGSSPLQLISASALAPAESESGWAEIRKRRREIPTCSAAPGEAVPGCSGDRAGRRSCLGMAPRG